MRSCGGKTYFLAANCARFPVDARFRLPASLQRGAARVRALFEGRALPIEGAAFGEAVEPFGVRVYCIDRAWPEGEQVQIRSSFANLVPDPRFASQQEWHRSPPRDDADADGEASVRREGTAGDGRLHLRTSNQRKESVRAQCRRSFQLTLGKRAVRGPAWSGSHGRLRVFVSNPGRPGGTACVVLPNLAAEAETVAVTFIATDRRPKV